MVKQTHFGYQQVAPAEKTARVREVFDSVADRYDVMNDLMSLGLHRLWKRFALAASAVRAGAHVLDLAAGTGDITRALAQRVGDEGLVYSTDINARMLGAGRRRLIDSGIVRNVRFVQCNAESLPFARRSFDAVTIAFGLRNVTYKDRALEAMFDVLRPGGQLLVLEFSTLRVPWLQPLYDRYSFSVLPWLGKTVAADEASYRYLAESIRVHPDQETLLAMLRSAGFERCDCLNLSAGVAALHRGYKL
ncbi:MAG: ubiquinone/menaquinone biosynthesis methyltransferase [Gammaproteobacteria bacterium]|nr:ubiquinone/menaquinone biosynthesis methyltransferase [Gammaproteobacteria bacterium]